MKKILALMVLVSLCASCASMRNASEADDAQAKKFQTAPGKGALYVYYNEQGTAFQGPIDLYLSRGGTFEKTGRAEEWAMLPPFSFVRADLDPGSHGVVFLVIPTDVQQAFYLTGEVRIEAGKCKYLEIVPQRAAHLTDEPQAREVISRLHLVKSSLDDYRQKVMTTKLPQISRPSESIRVVNRDGTFQTIYIQQNRL